MSDNKTGMSFDDALGTEYNEPAIEIVATEPQQPPVQNLPPTFDQPKPAAHFLADSEGRVPESVWRSQPEKYFQRGSKKGLPRTSPYVKPLVSVAYEATPGDDELTGELIGGAMFITMIDLFLPGLFVLFNNWLLAKDKGDIIKMDEMQLDEKTIKRLEPVADKSLRRLKLRGDPTVWLLITMFGCYAMRFGQIQFERKLDTAMKDKE